MIESSLVISAIASRPVARSRDFDGAALLADDPFSGVTIAGGSIKLATALTRCHTKRHHRTETASNGRR